ncbi:Annexin [Giardia duodenalis]|uniref:Annexin n=1 Tax=Giardia intestinalis TaxID=5741 RepID=V6TMD8_GIAIN|nr:Annexin [Giardia intestinalis]
MEGTGGQRSRANSETGETSIECTRAFDEDPSVPLIWPGERTTAAAFTTRAGTTARPAGSRQISLPWKRRTGG